MTDPIHERRGVSITPGIANAMVHYGGARQCPECQFTVPRYPGRYPNKCPRCGEALVGCKTESAIGGIMGLLTERSKKDRDKAWLKSLLGSRYERFVRRLKVSAHDPKVIELYLGTLAKAQ